MSIDSSRGIILPPTSKSDKHKQYYLNAKIKKNKPWIDAAEGVVKLCTGIANIKYRDQNDYGENKMKAILLEWIIEVVSRK